MIRRVLRSATSVEQARDLVATAPLTRTVVHRFVAGEGPADAVLTTGGWSRPAACVTLDHLGEDISDLGQAPRRRRVRPCSAGSPTRASPSDAEVSLKLSAVGQALPGDGERIALDHAHQVCPAADAAGTTVTLDMEDHTTTDSTLRILGELRTDFPPTGAVLQSYLHRTEADCRDLATPARGSGCARARTRSPRRSRSRTGPMSTRPTCGA